MRVSRRSDQRVTSWQFPTGPTPQWTVALPGRAGYYAAQVERPPGGPTGFLRAYQAVTMPGTLLALCLVLTLAAAIVRRPRADFLLVAAFGLVLVLVPATTVSLDYRFLLPELVVAPVGAALALQALRGRRAERQPECSTANATNPSSTASATSSWSTSCRVSTGSR